MEGEHDSEVDSAAAQALSQVKGNPIPGGGVLQWTCTTSCGGVARDTSADGEWLRAEEWAHCLERLGVAEPKYDAARPSF